MMIEFKQKFLSMDIKKSYYKLKEFAMKKININESLFNTLYSWLGVILIFSGVIYSVLQLCPFLDALLLFTCPYLRISSSIGCTYIALLCISIGMAFFLLGMRSRWKNQRRSVELAELQGLFAEVEMFKEKRETGSLKVAEDEVERLKKLCNTSKTIVELEVLSLRKALVDLYPPDELTTKAYEELSLLWEATPDSPQYENFYEFWRGRIEKAKDKIEGEKDERVKDKDSEKLRSELKALRKKVAWFDKQWVDGELYIREISFWSAVTSLVMLLVGILPIIHPDGGVLNYLHWGALGWCGALLSTLVGMSQLDVNEVGEQQGKQVFMNTVGKTSIGPIASILLFAALNGEILAGKLFPEFPIKEGDILNIGKSIFWGVFGGFSLKILATLASVAESPFAKKEGPTEQIYDSSWQNVRKK